MNRAHVILTLLTALASASFAQHSITLTSPTSGQVIQGTTLYGQWPTVKPTATVTDSSGNSTAYVLYLFNGKPFADNVNLSYVRNTGDPNWTATFHPALWGDGTGTMQAISFDIFGNQLAASSIVSFQLRVSGDAVGLMDTVQTSGTGTFRATINVGINASMNGALFIDGRGSDNEWQTNQTGWANGPTVTVKTNRFINGPHEIMFATGTGGGAFPEPFVLASSFANSAVSASSITVPGHWYKELEPVALSTTGTLPSPLVTGNAWYWTTSSPAYGSVGTSNTFTASVTSGVMTITTSSAHGISPGASVYVFGAVIGSGSFQALSSIGGAVQLCDGLYTAVTASGSTITLNTPSCPNGAYTGTPGMEVYTNPYFVHYIDNSTIALASTPGGTPITLSTAGASGTHTVTGRPMWNPQITQSQRLANGGEPLFFAYQNVTFANGTTPMELRPAFAELHGVAGTSGPSLCNALGGTTGPMIFNTDGTSTTINCNAVTYTPTTDLIPNVATVDANGNVSYVTPGWTHVVVACATCNAGGSLPSVTVWIQVQSGSVTFPHFTVNGVTSTYVTGQSLFPRTMWNLDTYAFLNPGLGVTAPLYQQSMMKLANINAVQNSGLTSDVLDPVHPGPCGTYPVAADTLRWNWMAANPYVRTEQNWTSSLVFSSGAFIDAYLNNVNYPTGTRAACYAGYWTSVRANAKTYLVLSADEVNNNFSGGLLTHDFTGAGASSLIGSTFFQTFTTNSSGLATITGQIDLRSASYVWNQSTGVGEYVRLKGSTIGSLNGIYPIQSITLCPNQAVLEGLFCTMTIQTPCISCTQTSSNDPNLELVHWDTVIAGRSCVVPSLVGSNDNTQIGWGTNGPSSIVSDGATHSNLTVNWTGHKFVAGQVLHIFSATNTGLNLYSIVAGVTTNSFTVVALTTVTAGTYNNSTDSGAQFSRDCDFPNNVYTTIRTNLLTANAPPQSLTIIGTTYGKPYLAATYSYIGNPANTDAVLRYHCCSAANVYGYDESVSGNAASISTESITVRPWQITTGPLGDLLGSGGCQCLKFHQGFIPDLRYDRINSAGNLRPENIAVSIGHILSASATHLKLYLFDGQQVSAYNAGPNGLIGGTAINPNTHPVQWAAWAWGNAFLQMLSKYLLQPQMNTPYLGPMFATSTHTSSFGNILTIACENETPYQQTVNLTPYRLTGGSSYRVSLTGYRLTVTGLAGNPTSDTYNFCGHGPGGTQSPGETVAYVFQPSSAISDIVNQQFSAPASPLPYGASKFLIRYGYFGPGMVEGQDPIIDCTTGCMVPINNASVNAFYQTIYADSNFKSLASGDPMLVTALNPNP